MTDGQEFRNRPQPGDWTFPPGWLNALQGDGGLDPIAIAFLSEGDYEGVPIPFGVQVGSQTAQYLRRLDHDNVTMVTSEFIASYANHEERYPDAPMWDRGRTIMLAELAQQGHYTEALRVAHSVRDAHRLINAIFETEGLAEIAENEQWLKGMVVNGTPERVIDITKAIRDHLITTDPLDPLIDRYNTMLASKIENYDWVRDWADSQQRQQPDADWVGTAAVLQNIQWGDVPMPVRMNTYAIFHGTIDQIHDNAMEETFVESVNNFFAAVGERYPDVVMWGQLHANVAVALIHTRHPQEAVEIGACIQDSAFMGSATLAFIAAGADEAAMELAARNPDYALGAEILFDGHFTNPEVATRRLAEIISDETASPDQRIAFLQVAIERMLAVDDLSLAAKYQQMIVNIQRSRGNQ